MRALRFLLPVSLFFEASGTRASVSCSRLSLWIISPLKLLVSLCGFWMIRESESFSGTLIVAVIFFMFSIDSVDEIQVGVRRNQSMCGLFKLKQLFMGLLLLSVAISLASVHSVASEVADPLGSSPWEQLGSKDGIKLGRKLIPNSDLFAVRGETEIPANIDQVASVICDHTRWIEWTKSMKGSKLIKQESDTRKIAYQSFDLPWPVEDRDVVYFYSAERKNRNGELVEIIGKTTPEARKLAPESIGTRMNLVIGRWHLRPINPSRTHLVLEILMDPKGALPSWFVNIVQRNYPVETLTRLKEQALKADIKPLLIPTSADGAQTVAPIVESASPAPTQSP